jgi:hypothetical protein
MQWMVKIYDRAGSTKYVTPQRQLTRRHAKSSGINSRLFHVSMPLQYSCVFGCLFVYLNGEQGLLECNVKESDLVSTGRVYGLREAWRRRVWAGLVMSKQRRTGVMCRPRVLASSAAFRFQRKVPCFIRICVS